MCAANNTNWHHSQFWNYAGHGFEISIGCLENEPNSLRGRYWWETVVVITQDCERYDWTWEGLGMALMAGMIFPARIQGMVKTKKGQPIILTIDYRSVNTGDVPCAEVYYALRKPLDTLVRWLAGNELL